MITRRETLHRFALGGAMVFAGTLPWTRALATPLPVRREVSGLALNDPDIQTLRDGVGILKARLPGQGPSWTDMATIHGTAGGFNKCPHRNWYFLPWHRAYLLMYERMIRSVTGNNAFAMPYWDWTAHPALPPAFTGATYNGQSNPLYVGTRNNGYSVPVGTAGTAVMNGIYGQTNFELFGSSRPAGQNNTNASWITTTSTQGTLEQTPHNLIHGGLGGFMGQGNSPMDPIFLMHHGNIDHVWWRWNCIGHANTTDPLWLNMPFTNNYYNPNGSWATYKPSDVLNIGALGYSYGLCLRRVLWPAVRVYADLRLAEIFRTGRAADAGRLGAQLLQVRSQRTGPAFDAVGAAPPRSLRNTFTNLSARLAASPRLRAEQKISQVVALIHNLTPPSDAVEVLVFAGIGELPPVNDPTDRHFVTRIGFFGAHAHGHGGVSASVDLTDHLRAIGAQADQVQLRLVARATGPVEGDVQATVAGAEVELVIV